MGGVGPAGGTRGLASSHGQREALEGWGLANLGVSEGAWGMVVWRLIGKEWELLNSRGGALG